jgi:hypothetical protein
VRRYGRRALIAKEFTMKNIKTTVKGNTMTIEIDLSKTFGPSKSGKTIIVASTEGNQKVEGSDVVIGINAYKKAS